ncbi:replication protein A 70 kDa DNA-binding subunit B-like [Olea europaea var. sylvestris]|uniref:replication protein A 70 kDa DNA-binding subunit B-like n=1 Tax=Olea europaea var. sylvestris TaxID=158386 RepID=UPI000C1D41E7|nr:replication protein A 70 kDa DNA-binding subunit B-like [Olea europaea var. sylvestris]
MAEYKLIPDIKPGESGWTVKAVVSEKCSPTKARNSPLKYQHIWLMDPKGNKVQATLFDSSITAFEDTLLLHKTYLISNAQVKETATYYRAQLGHIRWTINAKTNIVEVDEQFNSLLSSTYNFISFENLQRYMDTNAEISIIGIAVDIFPKRVIQIRDNQSTVQDVILMNERFETRMLQMWDNFVANECNTIHNTITKKPIVVSNRLRVTSFNGISVSTKMNSSILINPSFEQVVELKHWLEENIITINDIVTRKAYIFPTSTTISCPPEEKLINIKQLQHMPSVNETYFCRFCKHNYATPTPRARAIVQLQDYTGSITASIIGKPAETFLNCPATELMKQSSNEHMESSSTIPATTPREHIVYIKAGNIETTTNKPPYEVIFILDSHLQDDNQLPANITQPSTTHEAPKHVDKKQKQE